MGTCIVKNCRRESESNEFCGICHAFIITGEGTSNQLYQNACRASDASFSVIDMLLWCPECGGRHIDSNDPLVPPHRTHACQHCGMQWRPSNLRTRGVNFLPGARNDSSDHED